MLHVCNADVLNNLGEMAFLSHQLEGGDQFVFQDTVSIPVYVDSNSIFTAGVLFQSLLAFKLSLCRGRVLETSSMELWEESSRFI